MLKDNLFVTNFMLQHIQINKNVIDNDKYKLIFSVEEVNKLVVSGMSFRDAYQKVGSEILKGNFVTDKNVKHTHKGSIGNLCLDALILKMRNSIIQEQNK